MASALHSNLTFSTFLYPKPNLKTLTKPPNTTIATTIRCGGPRSNRGPLVRGRILSTEAILAVQSLKRAYKKSSSNLTDLPDLSRLIKSDLLSILRELLRQDLCPLAIHVLSTLRSEYSGQIDLGLYADVISGLSRNKLCEHIDKLIEYLEKDEGGIQWETDKGLLRVIRGVVDAGRRESAVKICEILRRSGCGETWPADEYVVGVLSKGLRRMGETELASEVDEKFGGIFRGGAFA
ncbi:protein THYLAKOID ASSEMBLY 8, chloroplastic [Hevea brasiliensis]|uniref:protein THYLAKOID ASSEMBLY 8, chloroplastic n=1 Tax=Hevea brasiliensis TaxID=3981 RepID=UPI0025E77ABC|nr:protein THYLAKOID ASSEMBLY 8, chloroplastic [Hevea brasiliensis]